MSDDLEELAKVCESAPAGANYGAWCGSGAAWSFYIDEYEPDLYSMADIVLVFKKMYGRDPVLSGSWSSNNNQDQVSLLTEALNNLLESAKLCKECNVHLDSLTEAMDHAERVLAKTGGHR